MATTMKIENPVQLKLSRFTALASKVFQEHGFSAPVALAGVDQMLQSSNKGWLTITFPEETTAGMAAFSQKTVTPSFQMFHEALSRSKAEIPPWELWNLNFEVDEVSVRLHIDYQHHNGGHNGYTRDYRVKAGKLVCFRD